jgi:LPS-assembly protein
MKQIIALLGLILFFASFSQAEEAIISADSIEQKGTSYTAEGSVRIQRGDAVLQADKASYDQSTADAEAEGNVFYEDQKVTIKADRAVLNLRTKTGVLYNAEILIKEGNYHIRGAKVEKTGENRYFLKNASVTTCDAPLPAWCLRGSDVDIIIGDRLKAKHASLAIKGIPLFYTPYVWAPILTERKTGFLIPTVGYRKSKGIYIRQPFFWAISENRDATFYLDLYTLRGVGKGIEYRYIERADLSGLFNIYHLRDRELKKDFTEVRASHRQTGGWLDLNLVNHREFYRLYEPYLELSSKRFLESEAEMSMHAGNSRLYLTSQYLFDLKDGTDQSSIPQRLPEAGFFYAPKRLGPVVLTVSSTVSNFWVKQGDDTKRFDIYLRAFHSAGRGPSLLQTFGARHSVYDTDDTFSRRSYDYSAVLKARFIRDYRNITHAVEPSLSYRYVFVDGKEPPFFDSVELVSETSVAEASLTSRFMDSKGEFATLRLIQPYDFKRGENHLLPLRLDASVQRLLRFRTSVSYDVNKGLLESVDSDVGIDLPKASVSVGQSYARGGDLRLYSLSIEYSPAAVFALNSSIWYDAKRGLREFKAGLRYQRQCWGVTMRYVKKREDYSLFLTINLIGLGFLEV